jgi:hypothetical protein
MPNEPPVVIDLGKVSNAQIKELFAGAGKLQEEIEEVMRLMKAAPEGYGRILVPVVAVYHATDTADEHDDIFANLGPLTRRNKSKLTRS